MRYGTAVRKLRTVAERCQEVSRFGDGKPVLVGAYVFGEVLEPRTEVSVVQMAFVLDRPADELTWCARPQSCNGLASLLQLDKAHVAWSWRPLARPVANHYVYRPLRVWSLDGPDTAALDALARGEAEDLRMPALTAAELHEQVTAELAASLTHLRRVEAGYWERDWRIANRGSGIYPENHLWEAVTGYLDLLNASQTDLHS